LTDVSVEILLIKMTIG